MRLNFRSTSVLSAMCFLMTTSACVSPGVRQSAIRWNLRSKQNRETAYHSSAQRLASRSQEELGRLMESQPAPEPSELVGTWYGVNFKDMPELSAPHAYAFAVSIMVVTTVATFWYFKRRRWL